MRCVACGNAVSAAELCGICRSRLTELWKIEPIVCRCRKCKEWPMELEQFMKIFPDHAADAIGADCLLVVFHSRKGCVRCAPNRATSLAAHIYRLSPAGEREPAG